MANQLSDQLRHGQRRAEELRQAHGAHLSQEAQTLIGSANQFGLPQLLAADQESRRKTFALFLANSASTAAERARAERIGQILEGVDGSPTLQDGMQNLEQDDMPYIGERLNEYNQRLEVVDACAEHIAPAELQGLFAGNPRLEQLFTTAGKNPDDMKKALKGAFEWAAASDEATYRTLYGLLNNFAQHKTAEKRLGSVLAEKMLNNLATKHNIDMKELRKQVDPAAPRAENIRRVQDFLQASGMGIIRSWMGARRVDIVSNIVTHLTQNQEAHLQDVANVCNVLLSNDTIYQGAFDALVKGTAMAPMSQVLTKETYADDKMLVDEAYDRNTRTLSPNVEQAYREHLQASGMTQSNDRAFQRDFLDNYYEQRTRGHGFLRWLMNTLWGRKRNEITRSRLLDGVTV
jgi:hypothetical protein